MNFKKTVILIMALSFVLFSTQAIAKRKPGLKKGQLKTLVKHAVKDLSASPFIKGIDLGDRFVLAKIAVDPKAHLGERFVTNAVLNQLLGYSPYQILNQDLTTDLSIQFSLTEYNDMRLAVPRGILLGANYIIHGSLSYKEQITDKGVMKFYFQLNLKISDIRSLKVLAEAVQNTRLKTKK